MAKNGTAAIGRGVFTPLKQRDLEKFLRQYLLVCRAVIKRNPWASPELFVADITAGMGVHPETGEEGSPLILLRLLEEFHVAYQAFFIEQEPDNFASLQRLVDDRFWSVSHLCSFVKGDHVEEMAHIVRQHLRLKPPSFGLLYYDFTTDDYERSLRFLADLYTRYFHLLKFIDCLIYLSATAVKRVRGAFPDRPDLTAYLRAIRKDQWLVREPSGGNQYTFLLGTNYKKYRTSIPIGLFPISEPRGKGILERLNFNTKEMGARYQPALFPSL